MFKLSALVICVSLLINTGCSVLTQNDLSGLDTKIATHNMAKSETRDVNTMQVTKKETPLRNNQAFFSVIKKIQIKLVELQDSQGLKYVGGVVTEKDLETYLTQLEVFLGDEFVHYRMQQQKRDHSTFHMTLVNPYEFMELAKPVEFGQFFDVELVGLGRVLKENQATYFVVANSIKAQAYRKSLMLKEKDFHVTLGFDPNDIYGVRKNEDTLMFPVKTGN